MNTYVVGYNGKVKTKEELMTWPQWINLDEEMQRRVLAILDDSLTAGTPLGIGEIFRTFETQESGFLARHHQVPPSSPHCCTYQGKCYQLNAQTAHMAPPNLSYHEKTTLKGKALAVDFTGHLSFLTKFHDRYGLVEFSKVGNEPWHGQPGEVPHGRARYVPATMDPLKPFVLPGQPSGPTPLLPAPLQVWAPNTAMVVGAVTASAIDVGNFQLTCNFWGWRDRMGRTLLVDRSYGPKSAEACCAMQRALNIRVDGKYMSETRMALQKFLNAMVVLPK